MGAMPGAGGDEDGIGDGLLEHEVAVGTVDLDGRADGQVGQIGEVIGEEAFSTRFTHSSNWLPRAAEAME